MAGAGCSRAAAGGKRRAGQLRGSERPGGAPPAQSLFQEEVLQLLTFSGAVPVTGTHCGSEGVDHGSGRQRLGWALQCARPLSLAVGPAQQLSGCSVGAPPARAARAHLAGGADAKAAQAADALVSGERLGGAGGGGAQLAHLALRIGLGVSLAHHGEEGAAAGVAKGQGAALRAGREARKGASGG